MPRTAPSATARTSKARRKAAAGRPRARARRLGRRDREEHLEGLRGDRDAGVVGRPRREPDPRPRDPDEREARRARPRRVQDRHAARDSGRRHRERAPRLPHRDRGERPRSPPYSIAPLPDGRILVTEKVRGLQHRRARREALGAHRGHATRLRRRQRAPRLVYGMGWMLDVALHPEYAKNGWIYLLARRSLPRVRPPR